MIQAQDRVQNEFHFPPTTGQIVFFCHPNRFYSPRQNRGQLLHQPAYKSDRQALLLVYLFLWSQPVRSP